MAAGIALAVIGNVVPRLGPNLALGIRTGRTLSDRRSWMATHRVAGYAGVAVGLPYAWLASHLVRSLLFGVTPADPLSAALAVGALVAAAFVAAWLPARRAARTDPLLVLRRE